MTQQPPPNWQQYLATLLTAYITAEESLLGGVAGILRLTSPDRLSQLLALGRMRALSNGVVQQLFDADRLIGPLVSKAITAGTRSGMVEVRRAGVPPRRPFSTDLALIPEPFDFGMPHGIRSERAIRADLVSSLDDVKRRITRLPDDVYKLISPASAAGQVLGRGYTPAQAQAYAWQAYVKRGVAGFTDRSGRDWSLSAYVEMSVRTATLRAFNDAHLQVITATGSNLVIVSDDGHPCPLCFPWQNVVLAVVPDGKHPSIADAIAAGLMHPNCKHVWTIYIPGITVLPAPREWSDDDARLYKLTQQQRRLEREVRNAKKQLEYATDPATAADSRAAVRKAQANMRQFIDQTGFIRQSRREQVDLANDRLKLPA
ncbi:phage minor capsid protein [Subtercola sp. PAMC28395]|uniref:phage minor capsid protein n=1 Tax=Subtercola sp. PAMC28395 TaxID=2846775 RepID=UPI001C0E7FF5|nr:phage minor capsid protein [Subtercola sp. PAMC28395]QWT24948.1 phage minor capsid protein [Subtercola sp. PAMC28395]